MKHCIPMINSNNLLSSNKDDNKMCIKSKILENEITLNKTSTEIYEFIDGENSVKDIVEKMHNKYEVEKKLLETDVYNCIKNLWFKGFITWKDNISLFSDEYTYKIDNVYTVQSVNFDNINILKKKKETKIIYKYPFYHKNINIADIIQKNNFLNNTNAFILYKKEEPILITMFDHNNLILNIRYIWEDEYVDVMEKELFFEKVIDIYKDTVYVPKNHTIAYMITICENSEFNQNILDNYKFNKVGTLEKEYIDGSNVNV